MNEAMSHPVFIEPADSASDSTEASYRFADGHLEPVSLAVPRFLQVDCKLLDTWPTDDFDTRMRNIWTNRAIMLQAVHRGLMSVRSSVGEHKRTRAWDQLLQDLDDSVTTFALSDKRMTVAEWSFTKAGSMTVDQIREQHALLTRAWQVFVSRNGLLVQTVFSCLQQGVDLTPLRLSFTFASGRRGPKYTEFPALMPIWLQQPSSRKDGLSDAWWEQSQ